MAICRDCDQEMKDHVGCTLKTIHMHDGKTLYRIKYENMSNNCHDCGCPPNSYHHLGCDMEICPECEGQLISCGCWQED
jgi:hypothetical protein